MAYTYNVSENRGRIRLLIGDRTSESPAVYGEHYVFEDSEIDALLDLNGDDVWRAASDACRRLAADEVLGSIRLSLSGFSIDRSQVSRTWLELANKYDEKANIGDIVEYVDSFDHQISQFGEDETEYVGDIL